MTKKIDKDVLVLTRCIKALNQSSCHRMLIANMAFLYDRYVLHPDKHSLPEHLKKN